MMPVNGGPSRNATHNLYTAHAVPRRGASVTAGGARRREQLETLRGADTVYSVSHNRIQTAAINAPEQWSGFEKIRYGAYSLVWWSRRIPGDSSRQADAQAVASFLIEKNLWENDRPLAKLSANVLRRLDIERAFWWISTTQIDALADMISAFASRSPRGSNDDFRDLVYFSLFGRQTADI